MVTSDMERVATCECAGDSYLPHSLSGRRALGPLNYAIFDSAGGVPGDLPGDRLYACIQSRLKSLLDGSITALILPARSTLTLFYLTWRGGISPAESRRQGGFSKCIGDDNMRRRIMSDQFISLACQADFKLAIERATCDGESGLTEDAQMAIAEGRPVIWVQDDMCLFNVKRGRICQIVSRAFSAVTPPEAPKPYIDSDKVFDYVYENIDTAVALEDAGYQTEIADQPSSRSDQLRQELASLDSGCGWINNHYMESKQPAGRKPFLKNHRLLAGLASRHLAVLHKYVNHACLGSSLPLLAWAPLAESNTVRADSFASLLYDTESWHWLDTTAAANAGAGRRDYQLFPQKALARQIRDSLGDAAKIVDFLVLHLSTSERVFQCDFNLTPVVRLKPLKKTAVETWLSSLMGRSIQEMVEQYLLGGSHDQGAGSTDRTAYERRLVKEAVQLIAYTLSRQVFQVVRDYIEQKKDTWGIRPDADKVAIVPVEDADYGRFLLGDKLFSRSRDWLESESNDAMSTLVQEGLVAPDEQGWEGNPLQAFFPELGDVDHGYLGDFVESEEECINYDLRLSIYDLLMGWCKESRRVLKSSSTNNLDLDKPNNSRGHLPWLVSNGVETLPCDNRFCLDWQQGILSRTEPMTLGDIRQQLNKMIQAEKIDDHYEEAMESSHSIQRLRIHLMVLSAVGFAVPTVTMRQWGSNDMLVEDAINRGESGQKFFTSPLGGQWAPGRVTSLLNSRS